MAIRALQTRPVTTQGALIGLTPKRVSVHLGPRPLLFSTGPRALMGSTQVKLSASLEVPHHQQSALNGTLVWLSRAGATASLEGFQPAPGELTVVRLAMGEAVLEASAPLVGVSLAFDGQLYLRNGPRMYKASIAPALAQAGGSAATVTGVLLALGRGNIITRSVGHEGPGSFVVSGFDATLKS